MNAKVFGIACVLFSCAALAQESGYLRTRVPNTELCLHWQTRNYAYNYHSAGSQQTPGTAEFVAMESSFDTWRTLARSCSDFTFTRGPDVGVAKIGYDQTNADNTNVIVFRELNCRDAVPMNDPCLAEGTCATNYQCWDHSDATIALTTTTFSFKSAIIFDADIEFNAAPQEGGYRFLFTTISSPPCESGQESALCTATDIQNTLTHEIGHAVGFDHVDIDGSTMQPSAPLGETRKRILDNGTAAGFCYTYPKGESESPPCEDLGEVEKKIVAVNRGTPGLDHMGCSVAGGVFAWLSLLALAGAARRRQRRPQAVRRAKALARAELLEDLAALERSDPTPPAIVASVARSLGLRRAVVARAVQGSASPRRRKAGT